MMGDEAGWDGGVLNAAVAIVPEAMVDLDICTPQYGISTRSSKRQSVWDSKRTPYPPKRTFLCGRAPL